MSVASCDQLEGISASSILKTMDPSGLVMTERRRSYVTVPSGSTPLRVNRRAMGRPAPVLMERVSTDFVAELRPSRTLTDSIMISPSAWEHSAPPSSRSLVMCFARLRDVERRLAVGSDIGRRVRSVRSPGLQARELYSGGRHNGQGRRVLQRARPLLLRGAGIARRPLLAWMVVRWTRVRRCLH